MQNTFKQHFIDALKTKNSTLRQFLVVLFFGFTGIQHYFYYNNHKLGVIYLITFGIFGFGWLFDIIKALILLITFGMD